MNKIAIIHRRFGVGGGEAVCFRIIEALQDDHEIEIYALNEPDFQQLNSIFGTAVDRHPVHTPSSFGFELGNLLSILEVLSGGHIGSQGALQLALLKSEFEREWPSFDLRITTHGELPLSSPTIQYIHHPFLNRWDGSGAFEIDGTAGKILNKIFTDHIGATKHRIGDTCLLANSKWSADQIEALYQHRPDVLYPPISTRQFSPPPWEEREDGFVTVGRLAPDKRTLQACKIIEQVRKQGYKVHLHIIGPEGEDESYLKSIKQYVSENDWVKLEGQLNRPELVQLLKKHRWGIHTKPEEHFGMVVAEFVAAGMIPFVHDSGGQIEIVGEEHRLRYQSSTEAATAIASVLDTPERGKAIKQSLPDPENRFGIERFESAIKEIVLSKL